MADHAGKKDLAVETSSMMEKGEPHPHQLVFLTPEDEVESKAKARSCGDIGVNTWRSWNSRNAVLSVLTLNGIVCLLALNGIFAFFSVNAAFSIFSVNSILSIASINSMLSVGCSGGWMKICV